MRVDADVVLAAMRKDEDEIAVLRPTPAGHNSSIVEGTLPASRFMIVQAAFT